MQFYVLRFTVSHVIWLSFSYLWYLFLVLGTAKRLHISHSLFSFSLNCCTSATFEVVDNISSNFGNQNLVSFLLGADFQTPNLSLTPLLLAHPHSTARSILRCPCLLIPTPQPVPFSAVLACSSPLHSPFHSPLSLLAHPHSTARSILRCPCKSLLKRSVGLQILERFSLTLK